MDNNIKDKIEALREKMNNSAEDKIKDKAQKQNNSNANFININGRFVPTDKAFSDQKPLKQRPVEISTEKKNEIKSKLDELAKESHLQELKRNALKFDSSQKVYFDAEDLLKDMANVSVIYKSPILSSFNGKQFVVEANSSLEQACEAWVVQTRNIQETSYDNLKKLLSVSSEAFTNEPEKKTLYEVEDRKLAEVLIQNYPEKADILNTIQLHNVYYENFGKGKDINSTTEKLLKASIKEYMSGKETFKPNIYNVAHLDELKEFAFKSGMYSMEELNKRISKTEADMLTSIDYKNLKEYSNEALNFIAKVAAKHPDSAVAIKLSENSLKTMYKLRSNVSSN